MRRPKKASGRNAANTEGAHGCQYTRWRVSSSADSLFARPAGANVTTHGRIGIRHAEERLLQRPPLNRRRGRSTNVLAPLFVASLSLAVALLAPPAPPASAQIANGRIDPDTVPRPSMEARRADSPITLDGVLSDVAWALADSTRGDFHQSIPHQGMPSAERTVVRVLYDDERLYIGATMYDSRPEALVSAGMEQDFANPGLRHLRVRAGHVPRPPERLPLRGHSGRGGPLRRAGLQRSAVGESRVGGRGGGRPRRSTTGAGWRRSPSR